MPISLRLPADIESQIAGYGARAGLSKSAVIVRSIQEFLARHAEPTSLQIYEEAMHEAQENSRGAEADRHKESLEQRPHKLQARNAMRTQHAQRAARAAKGQ